MISTENEKWKEKQDFSQKSGTEILFGDPVGRPVFGWGCCFSEICVKAIFSLPAHKQEMIFDSLFGDDGCGLRYCRLSVGANVYWNMALDNDGVSTWGWKQNSLISVKNGDFCFNPEFYMLLHFSKYAKKGAVPLQTKGEMSSNTTAFRNPDGTVTAVVLNPFDIEKTVTLGGKNCVLPPRSFNTFVI